MEKKKKTSCNKFKGLLSNLNPLQIVGVIFLCINKCLV